MLENAVYSVISPEGCASILWKDPKKVKEAAECLKMTAADLLRLGVVERVVPEKGRDFDELSASLGQALADKLAEKRALPVEDLLRARYEMCIRDRAYPGKYDNKGTPFPADAYGFRV